MLACGVFVVFAESTRTEPASFSTIGCRPKRTFSCIWPNSNWSRTKSSRRPCRCWTRAAAATTATTPRQRRRQIPHRPAPIGVRTRRRRPAAELRQRWRHLRPEDAVGVEVEVRRPTRRRRRLERTLPLDGKPPAMHSTFPLRVPHRWRHRRSHSSRRSCRRLRRKVRARVSAIRSQHAAISGPQSSLSIFPIRTRID